MLAHQLEFPFSNIAEEIRHFSLFSPRSHLSWFEWSFAGKLKGDNIAFATDIYVINTHPHAAHQVGAHLGQFGCYLTLWRAVQ